MSKYNDDKMLDRKITLLLHYKLLQFKKLFNF